MKASFNLVNTENLNNKTHIDQGFWYGFMNQISFFVVPERTTIVNFVTVNQLFMLL